MISATHNKTDKLRTGPILPDVTSLLDILFILLVFFMITAGTVFKSLELQLPQNKAAEKDVQTPEKQVVLEIDSEIFVFNGERYTDLSGLETAVHSFATDKPEHTLIVATDKDVTSERLLKVLAVVKEKGVTAAHILIQKENIK